MTLQDKIAADKVAVEQAQAQLDADQAAFDAALPHLSVLAEIEAFSQHVTDDVRAAFDEVVTRAKSLF